MRNLAQVGSQSDDHKVALDLQLPTPIVFHVTLQIVDGHLPDVLRGTAASALCRLLRCQPGCLAALVDMGGVDLIVAGELCSELTFKRFSCCPGVFLVALEASAEPLAGVQVSLTAARACSKRA